MPNISAVIVVKNEADRIANTIASAASVCDEVLVVDTGSTDDTISIAKSAGAIVKSLEWSGYGSTKNQAVLLATNDWVLSLDADEVLSAELQHTLHELCPQEHKVYALDRVINFDGRWIKHSGWYPDWVPRLYHRFQSSWNNAKVHEKLDYPTSTMLVRLSGQLYHYSFRSVEHFRVKTRRYAFLAAQEWVDQGISPPLLKQWLGPQWKYFQMYYINQGYKDGKEGKLIAQILAEGVRQKIAYYKQLSVK